MGHVTPAPAFYYPTDPQIEEQKVLEIETGRNNHRNEKNK